MVQDRDVDFSRTITPDTFRESMAKRTWRGAVIKLLHATRLARHGRRCRRSKDHIKRNRTLSLWDAPSQEETSFMSRVMTAIPLMRRASCHLQTLCDTTSPEDCEEIPSLAVDAIHQSRVCTARIAWREFAETSASLRAEAALDKSRFQTLQTQFQTARSEYLKEVTALRNQVRIRGDPESCIRKELTNFDVRFFFDPLNALQPHELDFASKVIAEKLKMIFEANPTVTKTVDFGQVEQVSKLAESSEVAKLKQALKQRVAQLADLEKEHLRIQKQCHLVDFSMAAAEAAAVAAEAAAVAAESDDVASKSEIARLQDKTASLSETQREMERALAQQYSLVEVRTLERDEVTAALKEMEESQVARQENSETVSGATCRQEGRLQQCASKEDDMFGFQQCASKEEVMSEHVQGLQNENFVLVETNTRLRRTILHLRQQLQDIEQDHSGRPSADPREVVSISGTEPVHIPAGLSESSLFPLLLSASSRSASPEAVVAGHTQRVEADICGVCHDVPGKAEQVPDSFTIRAVWHDVPGKAEQVPDSFTDGVAQMPPAAWLRCHPDHPDGVVSRQSLTDGTLNSSSAGIPRKPQEVVGQDVGSIGGDLSIEPEQILPTFLSGASLQKPQEMFEQDRSTTISSMADHGGQEADLSLGVAKTLDGIAELADLHNGIASEIWKQTFQDIADDDVSTCVASVSSSCTTEVFASKATQESAEDANPGVCNLSAEVHDIVASEVDKSNEGANPGLSELSAKLHEAVTSEGQKKADVANPGLSKLAELHDNVRSLCEELLRQGKDELASDTEKLSKFLELVRGTLEADNAETTCRGEGVFNTCADARNSSLGVARSLMGRNEKNLRQELEERRRGEAWCAETLADGQLPTLLPVSQVSQHAFPDSCGSCRAANTPDMTAGAFYHNVQQLLDASRACDSSERSCSLDSSMQQHEQLQCGRNRGRSTQFSQLRLHSKSKAVEQPTVAAPSSLTAVSSRPPSVTAPRQRRSLVAISPRPPPDSSFNYCVRGVRPSSANAGLAREQMGQHAITQG